MEIIRKKISIDKSRSHEMGLLPFVHFETGEIIYSGITNTNNNYGHYICDLGVKIDASNIKDEVNDFEDLLLISPSSLSIGDKYLVSNPYETNAVITSTPPKTVFLWDGKQWIFYNKIIKYLDIINIYVEYKKIINNAIFCKCTKAKNDELILTKCNINANYVDNYISMPLSGCTTICEDNLYNYKVLDINSFTAINNSFKPINDEILINHNDYYILIDDYSTYLEMEEWGGDLGLSIETLSKDFTVIKYIEDNIIKSSEVTKDFFMVVPTVEVPLFLEEEFNYDTLYIPCEYILDGNETKDIMINGEIYNAKIGTNILPFSDFNENDGTKLDEAKNYDVLITSESRLSKLKHHSAIELVDGFVGVPEGWVTSNILSALTNNSIQVLTEEYASGQMFKCKFYTSGFTLNNDVKIYPKLQNDDVYQVIITEENEENISWWECMCVEENLSAYTCYDGLILPGEVYEKTYQNVVTLSCIPSYRIENFNEDNFYYYKALYQNGKIKPNNDDYITGYTEIKKVSFPFIVGRPVNIETYETGEVVYDMVLSANTINNHCNIEYVLGATSGVPESGIYYQETLNYSSGVTKNVFIDNVFETDLWYEKLDFDSNLKIHFNEIYNTNFSIREAIITKIEANHIEYINYPLITKDGIESLFEMPLVETDIIFNRGIASGFEKHFKLMECNTFQDLKNYGNNIFNL